MTSNIGSDYIQDLENEEEMNKRVSQALKNHFRPEFLNRVDEKIIFHSLSKEDLLNIVDIKIDDLREMLSERNLDITVTEEAKKEIMELGYDPTYGARPINRVIQKYLKDPLAMKLLEGDIEEESTVKIDFEDDFVFIVE